MMENTVKRLEAMMDKYGNFSFRNYGFNKLEIIGICKQIMEDTVWIVHQNMKPKAVRKARGE